MSDMMPESMFHTFTVVIPMDLFQRWRFDLENDEVTNFYTRIHGKVQDLFVAEIKADLESRENQQ